MYNQNQPNIQNVPNGSRSGMGNGSQGQQQPVPNGGYGKYTPSDDGITSLLTASPTDIGFDFDAASGEFQLKDNRQKPTAPSNQPNMTEQQQANTQPQDSSRSADPYTDRFTQIDNQFQSIGQALQRMAAYMEGLSKPQGQQQQQEQPVSLDLQSEDFATNLLNIVNTAIDRKFKSFEEKLTPLHQTNAQMNDRMILSDLLMEHGQQKVSGIMPALMELKKSDPNLDLRMAATALLKLPLSNQDSTIRTDNGNQQQAQAVQPQSEQNQQLQQRANQLSTESGGMPRGALNDETPIKGVEDAFNKSLRDLGYA